MLSAIKILLDFFRLFDVFVFGPNNVQISPWLTPILSVDVVAMAPMFIVSSFRLTPYGVVTDWAEASMAASSASCC